MLVNDIFMLPNISPFKLNKFLIVNWSKGLVFQSGKIIKRWKKKLNEKILKLRKS